jgi:adenine-specific DNA-methyltransferase
MSNNENEKYLTNQIITYLGNKRTLLSFIGEVINYVRKELSKDKLDIFDVFSGSGIVSRYFKKFSNHLYVNDLEDYAKTINLCYLTNSTEINLNDLDYWYNFLTSNLIDEKLIDNGFIRRLYSPYDDQHIQKGERVFYTVRNAKYIDTARQLLFILPEKYKNLFLGSLLYEASTKNNTGGVFKGFYKNSLTDIGQFGGNGKNALHRILADIKIEKPVLSNFDCDVNILQGDSNEVCKYLPFVDIAYIDPPYNQHPYGSNYFMLNLINNYHEPNKISQVSGIPEIWNKSNYNKKSLALPTLENLCSEIKARFVLVSFNSEGFISYESMIQMLKQFGSVKTYDRNYNVFRACRNLNERDIHVTEYLFLLDKMGKCEC